MFLIRIQRAPLTSVVLVKKYATNQNRTEYAEQLWEWARQFTQFRELKLVDHSPPERTVPPSG